MNIRSSQPSPSLHAPTQAELSTRIAAGFFKWGVMRVVAGTTLMRVEPSRVGPEMIPKGLKDVAFGAAMAGLSAVLPGAEQDATAK